MSWPDRARLSDHFSATSEAGREADQSHEVRHGTGRRHRRQMQRLRAVLSYSLLRRLPEAPGARGGRPPAVIRLYLRLSTDPAGLLCMAVSPTRSHFPRCKVGSRYGN